MAEMVEESYQTEVRRKTVRTSYKIEEVSRDHHRPPLQWVGDLGVMTDRAHTFDVHCSFFSGGMCARSPFFYVTHNNKSKKTHTYTYTQYKVDNTSTQHSHINTHTLAELSEFGALRVQTHSHTRTHERARAPFSALCQCCSVVFDGRLVGRG